MDYLNIAHCFGVLHRRSQAFVVEACTDLKLTFSEYVLLLKLYGNEGCSQDDMSGMLYMDKAVVTRIIKSLEAKGFIYREKDIHDRRMNRLYFTEFGKTQEKFLKSIIKKLVNSFSQGMDKKEIESMINGIQKVTSKL